MKPPITIIGAGAVGTSLALALHAGQYPIRSILSRTAAAATELATRVECGDAAGLDDMRLPSDGVVFIAVPDDALPEILARLCAAHAHAERHPDSAGLAAPEGDDCGPVVLHTSGALPGDILAPLREFNASVGSFHPLMLFPRGRSTGTEFTLCPVAIEGDVRAAAAAREIARSLNSRAFSIRPEKKTLYHIAAVFASNYFVTLLSVVERTGTAAGLPREEIVTLFEPLLRQTLDAVLRTTPHGALTGPIARNDRDTIRRHLDALRDIGDERTLSLYIELGLATARLAKEHE